MPERKKNMDYREFREKILEELKDFYGNDAYVKIQRIRKNNGVQKYGVVIQFTNNEPDSIVPIVYLEELYDYYNNGSMDTEECIGEIINNSEEFLKQQEEVKKMSANITDWEHVKHKVYPILLSRKDNKDLLKTLVTIDMLDLLVAYMAREEAVDGKISSIQINNFLFSRYGISKEELHMQALSNVKKDGYEFYEFTGILKNLIKDEPFADDIKENGCGTKGIMYIMTNTSMFYGTTGILDSKWLREKTDGINYYIIPSSVHELVFVPDNGSISQEDLDEVVQEVNNLMLKDEEKLSDHCYYYDAETGEIRTRR